MAPIVSFTAEEIWSYMPDREQRPASVFRSQMPEPDRARLNHELSDKWERIFRERSEVLKALEEARNKGIVGHSLDAKVQFFRDGANHASPLLDLMAADRAKMQDVLIVSQAESGQGEPDALVSAYAAELLGSTIAVSKADGAKCERCWKYDTAIGTDPNYPTVCPRCAQVLAAGVSA
jgi:isoleucyl-tRNA synthetase